MGGDLVRKFRLKNEFKNGDFFVAEKNAIWAQSRNFWKFHQAKNVGRASSYSSVTSFLGSLANKYRMNALTKTPDQAGIFPEIFIYNITLSWVKIIKTCITEKRVKEFSLILKTRISIVKFSINELHYSVTISLRLVGLVTEE